MPRTKRSPEANSMKRRLAATALAVAAAITASGAMADHGKFRDGYRSVDRPWHAPAYHAPDRADYRQRIRVHIPVRDYGPETLPLGRLIRRNSGLDMDGYRLVAVVIRNGRWSNGYASLRTGNRKSGRYFLGGHAQTRIPAPSGAERKWRLRLGPGTQVRSVTAILEPRSAQWSQTHPRSWKDPGRPLKRHGDRYRDQAASEDRRLPAERRGPRAGERRG